MKKIFSAIALSALAVSSAFAAGHSSVASQKKHQHYEFARSVEHFQSSTVCPKSHMHTYFSVFLHETDQANLDVMEVDALKRAIAKAKKEKGEDVQFWIAIDSYADARGSDEHNYKLTDRRAKAVMEALVKNGAPKHTIHVVSHGEKNAKYSNESEEGMQMNRASHVKVHSMTQSEAQFCWRNYPDSKMSIH